MFAHETLALGYIRSQRYDEAVTTIERSAALPASTTPFLLPWLRALMGNAGDALQLLEQLGIDGSGGGVPAGYADMWICGALAVLGNTSAAFRIVERSLEERRYSALMLNVEQAYEPLRSHPRFAKLIAGLGLRR